MSRRTRQAYASPLGPALWNVPRGPHALRWKAPSAMRACDRFGRAGGVTHGSNLRVAEDFGAADLQMAADDLAGRLLEARPTTGY